MCAQAQAPLPSTKPEKGAGRLQGPKEPFVGVCKGFCGNMLHEKKNLGANLSVQMDSSYGYESICTLKLALRFSFRAASSHTTMKKPSCEQSSQIRLEQHFGAILKRTPHYLGTPHIAPHRVYIDALPDVREDKTPPPSVTKLLKKGAGRSQCRTAGVSLCLFFTFMPFGSVCWRRNMPKPT